jgi:hypothetical protein
MNTLGFAAEASLYKSVRSYVGSVHTYSGDWSQIISPAFKIVFGGTRPLCDRVALQISADRLCESLVETRAKVIEDATGWQCSVGLCHATDYKYDPSDCSITSGHCDCEISCT